MYGYHSLHVEQKFVWKVFGTRTEELRLKQPKRTLSLGTKWRWVVNPLVKGWVGPSVKEHIPTLKGNRTHVYKYRLTELDRLHIFQNVTKILAHSHLTLGCHSEAVLTGIRPTGWLFLLDFVFLGYWKKWQYSGLKQGSIFSIHLLFNVPSICIPSRLILTLYTLWCWHSNANSSRKQNSYHTI